jgi:uncharacterized membrane protein
MLKIEFMKELALLLKSIPEHERIDILEDYEVHFAAAIQAGKQESIIVEALALTIAAPIGMIYYMGFSKELLI